MEKSGRFEDETKPPLVEMSLEQLQELAKKDFSAFRERFKQTLPKLGKMFSSNGNFLQTDWKSQPLADMLRATTATLSELGIEFPDPKAEAQSGSGLHVKATPSHDWKCLRSALVSASGDNAFVIAKAMAQALAGRSMIDCDDLMHEIIKWQPDRDSIIAAVPEFFRAVIPASVQASDFDIEKKSWPSANAIHILAGITPFDDDRLHALTLSTIRALKEVGVQNTCHPFDGSHCLHAAASNQPAPSLQAFLEEYPDDVNVQNNEGLRPLDVAAASTYPDAVKVLLEAGADTGPSPKNKLSPLDHSIGSQRYDNAMLLLDTGAYTDDDVERALSLRKDDPEGVGMMRVYHAAAKARQIAADPLTNGGALPRPL